jgi:hypothetical protein
VKFCQLIKTWYADDSALLRIVEDIEPRMFAVAGVNSDLEAISDWGQKWKVEFEPTKTHAAIFFSRPGGLIPTKSISLLWMGLRSVL